MTQMSPGVRSGRISQLTHFGLRRRSTRWLGLACQVLGMLGSVPALSASTGDDLARTFQAYGLVGTWAPDCKMPISRNNPRIVRHFPRGKPIEFAITFDGREWTMLSRPTSAEILPGDMIRFQFENPPGRTVIRTVERINGRIHLKHEVDGQGYVTVRDGEDVLWSIPTPFEERCEIDLPVS